MERKSKVLPGPAGVSKEAFDPLVTMDILDPLRRIDPRALRWTSY